MKTIVIWDDYAAGPIRFFVLEGDYSHLDRVYINSTDDDEKQEELMEVSTAPGLGMPMLDNFPLPLEPDDIVIVAGIKS